MQLMSVQSWTWQVQSNFHASIFLPKVICYYFIHEWKRRGPTMCVCALDPLVSDTPTFCNRFLTISHQLLSVFLSLFLICIWVCKNKFHLQITWQFRLEMRTYYGVVAVLMDYLGSVSSKPMWIRVATAESELTLGFSALVVNCLWQL